MRGWGWGGGGAKGSNWSVENRSAGARKKMLFCFVLFLFVCLFFFKRTNISHHRQTGLGTCCLISFTHLAIATNCEM